VSVQSTEDFVCTFKSPFLEDQNRNRVLWTGTEFTGGFLDAEEPIQSGQLGNLGVSGDSSGP